MDEETLDAAIDFMDRAVKADKPFFVWWNATRMHFRTHVKDENLGKTGISFYADAMVEHDSHVGALLEKVDDLGVKDNTIVFYSTDNGPHMNTWPDAGLTPFRGEKNTNWEALTVFQPWFAGLAKSRRVQSPMRSCTTWIGCPPLWLQQVTLISSRSC
ncbi:arylsulfatase [Vibrio astriarenae]|nr:arylsulfatase [Vibrio sp. C7]